MSYCTHCQRNTETWNGVCARCDPSLPAIVDDDDEKGTAVPVHAAPEPDPADQADQFWSFGAPRTDPADRQLAAHISARDTDQAEALIGEPAVTNASLKSASETERYLLRAYRRLSTSQRDRLLNTLNQLRTEPNRHASP